MNKQRIASYSYEFFLFLFVALYWVIFRDALFLDFWNDELYTLDHFVFAGYAQIVTDYHVPNNHIFFNLLNAAYLKTIGINDLDELILHPEVLRLLMLFYSIITYYAVFRIGKLLSNKLTGLVAAAVLITSLPFLNFALQIRGYGLSMALLSYLIFALLSYLKAPKKRWWWSVAVSVALLIYTVPSNLYIIAGILFFLLARLLNSFVSKQKHGVNPIIRIGFAPLLGIILSIILYAPVITDVFFNDYVNAGSPFNSEKITYTFRTTLVHFFSKRSFYFIFMAVGLILWVRKKKNIVLSGYFLAFCILITPFLLNYIRGDAAPHRIFVPLLPVFGLLIAKTMTTSFTLLHKLKFQLLLSVVILVYSLFQLRGERVKTSEFLYDQLELGIRHQDLKHQYYTAHYFPNRAASIMAEVQKKSKYPISIIGCERHGIKYFLEHHDLNYNYDLDIDSLIAADGYAHILTSRPNRILRNNKYQTKVLDQKLSYNTPLLCKANNDPFLKVAEIKSQQHNDSSINVGYLYLGLQANLVNYIPDSNDIISATKFLPNYGQIIHKLKDLDEIFVVQTAFSKFHERDKLFSIDFQLKDSVSRGNGWTINKYIKREVPLEPIYFDEVKQLISSDVEFSKAFKTKESKLSMNYFTHFTVRFKGQFKEKSNAVVVMTVEGNDPNSIWKSVAVKDFFNPDTPQQEVIASFDLMRKVHPKEEVSFYIWNSGFEEITVEDFAIFGHE